MPASMYTTADDAYVAFLSVPANRGNNSFLNNAWNGSLTEARRAAIRRIMVERGWRFEITGVYPPGATLAAPATAATPVADAAADEPATCNDAVNILNGQYTVRAGEETYKFRIFTIVRTQNDGLRNKRVVSYYDPDDMDWVTFAFLSKNGRLKVWRRFNDRASEDWQLAAKQLLHMLRRSHADTRAVGSDMDALGVTWSYTATAFTCRYCANTLTFDQREGGGHDGCSNYRRERPAVVEFTPLANRVYTPPTPVPAPAPPVRRSREVSTMSQVSGTWEQ